MNNEARRLTLARMQAAVFAALLGFITVASVSAKTDSDEKFSHIRIKNFGQMDERFYRGAQPKQADYKTLASLGINTIIDLRNDPKDYARSSAEAAGMRYINIPMSDKKRPQDEQIAEFLKHVNNPETGVMYVHCAGGRHRTGVMGAVYRHEQYKWNYEQAYKEMKEFDYYSRWGHGALKKYVQDYYERKSASPIIVNTGATASTSDPQ